MQLVWSIEVGNLCTLQMCIRDRGQTPRKQYKEKISDYRNWDQLEHAHDYLLYQMCIRDRYYINPTPMFYGDYSTSGHIFSHFYGSGSQTTLPRIGPVSYTHLFGYQS